MYDVHAEPQAATEPTVASLSTAILKAREDTTTGNIIIPFSLLPFELVLAICEVAAYDDKLTTAALSLVSHSVRACMLPRLFNTLVIQKRNSSFELAKFLEEKPHIARLVKQVYLRQGLPQDRALLMPCGNLERVALPPVCFLSMCEYWDVVASVSNRCLKTMGDRKEEYETTGLIVEDNDASPPPLRTPHELFLFAGPIGWHSINLRSPYLYSSAFFGGLTRLCLMHEYQTSGLLSCDAAVAALRSLTHLAANRLDAITRVPEVFERLPNVRILVLTHIDVPIRGGSMSGTLDPELIYAYSWEDHDGHLGADGAQRDTRTSSGLQRRIYTIEIDWRDSDKFTLALWKEGEDNFWTRIEKLEPSKVWGKGI